MSTANTLFLTGCLAVAGLVVPSGSLVAQTAPDTDAQVPDRPPPPRCEEMETYHELMLAVYDADDNGVLDQTERAAMKADMDAGIIDPPPMPRRGHRGPPPEVVAKYDANGDGTLDASERATLKADIESGVLVVPRHGRGAGRGFGPPPPPPGEMPPEG